MRRLALLLMCAVTLVCASQCSAQILHRKKKLDKSTDVSNNVEPDKQLYEKAMADIKRGHHEAGRLNLQTLINTYPDSEYLAKAKLGIADSYFKEGGNSNITQAVAGYKDFIVFFPFMPEAAHAQMQVAMANYNEMAKPDRDTTFARSAEEEFQTFLLKYPKDPLAPLAEQRLREVQEMLAEGQYRVAYFYYVKGDRRAAAGRLIPLVSRYPLYSKSDSALWMLGDIFEKSERKDVAGFYYAQIVKNYPLSSRAADAKGKLKAFGMPIPQADPKAVAWMRAEQNAPRPHKGLVRNPIAMLHSPPDVHMAAQNGSPVLEPESDDLGGDILSGGSRAAMATGGVATGTGIVATVKPGEPAPPGTSTSSTTTEDVNSNAGNDAATGTAGASGTDPQAGTTGTTAADGTKAGNASQDGSASTDNSKTDNTQPASADSDQNQKESSSKKKGLRKLLPW